MHVSFLLLLLLLWPASAFFTFSRNNGKIWGPEKLHHQSSSLSNVDPELWLLLQKENERQDLGINLIASENYCSAAVREVLGSCLTNKYSEGNVGARYYGGNQVIDEIEKLCMDRALALFKLNSNEWGVNVQPYSGSPANFAVYTALLQPHDRIMGLDLPSGGHLTHGYQTAKRKVSATSVYFESMPYIVNPVTGVLDYDELERRAKLFLPKLIIAGGSAYPREWDYVRIRSIVDSVGAIFMVDMAHISGLVAAGVVDNPFLHADVVTSTTHKTLRGPRSGIIFAKKEYMDVINKAVFPSLQGGPHNNQIGAVAVALKEASRPEFTRYAKLALNNARELSNSLQSRGHTVATGGTDNHYILWDVRPLGLTGSQMEKVLEAVSITVNKNTLPGDLSTMNPGGVRLGTPAMTTRGLSTTGCDRLADFLHRSSVLARKALSAASAEQGKAEKLSLKDFKFTLNSNESIRRDLQELRAEVKAFAKDFPMPTDISGQI